jgi:hypothetical protein
MWSLAKSMLGSKKFVAAGIASIVWGAGKLGLHIDSETLGGIIAPLLVYILGQGVADTGKSAALPAAKVVAE